MPSLTIWLESITKLALFVNYRIIICTLDYLCGSTAPGLQVDTTYFIFRVKYHTGSCRTWHLTNIDAWDNLLPLSLVSWPFMQSANRLLAGVFFCTLTTDYPRNQPGCGCLSVSGPGRRGTLVAVFVVRKLHPPELYWALLRPSSVQIRILGLFFCCLRLAELNVCSKISFNLPIFWSCTQPEVIAAD